MEKVYFVTLNAYMEDTIISSGSSSECMELDIDSTTNIDDRPKKSFLIPAGFNERLLDVEDGDLNIDLGIESGIESIDNIPVDSIAK